jgi:AbrB family looped-hinge helix DNA binding protein
MGRISVRVEKSGKVLIPADVRRRLGLRGGESEVVLEFSDSGPLTLAQALRRAQQVVSRHVSSNRNAEELLISEQLIAERTAGALRD